MLEHLHAAVDLIRERKWKSLAPYGHQVLFTLIANSGCPGHGTLPSFLLSICVVEKTADTLRSFLS